MSENKNSIYFMDKRFLMGFLLEESEEQARAARKIFAPDEKELKGLAEKFIALSPNLGEPFLSTARTLLPRVSEEEFHIWVNLGAGLMDLPGKRPETVLAYFASSLAVLTRTPFTYFKGWVEKGSEMAGISPECCEQYFSLSRFFIEYSNNIQLRKWGDWAMHMQSRGAPDNASGALFLHHSITCLKFMTFREFREYKELGFMFFRNDRDKGIRFFSADVEGLGKLEVTQRRDLYRLAKLISRSGPEEALAFFIRYPEHLSRVASNERNRALALIESISRSRPEKLQPVFDLLVKALEFRAYPVQLSILSACEKIARVSEEGAEAFLCHVCKILEQIPWLFLDEFVEAGFRESEPGPEQTISYFSLCSEKAGKELARWHSAVLLEDHQKALGLLAEAMTGKTLQVKAIQTGGLEANAVNEAFPFTDGKTLHLPAFMAESHSRQGNFEQYKAMVAHQAGLLEFKTFASDLSGMKEILGRLSRKDLALDLFFILEHGRIDFRLAGYYRGLRRNLARAVADEFAKRSEPANLPLQEALVEGILYYSVSGLSTGFYDLLKHPPDPLAPYTSWLGSALSGFYETAESAADCFTKALELYRTLVNLPNRLPGLPETSYRKTIPLYYRGAFYPEMAAENPKSETLPFHLQDSEKPTGHEGEDSALDRQDPDEDIISLEKGKGISGSGLYLDSGRTFDFKTGGEASEDEACATPFEAVPNSTFQGTLAREGIWLYDEWDYLQKAYRKNWCRLVEKPQEQGDPDKIHDMYSRHRRLIQKTRRQFEHLKPTVFDILPRVEWGDEMDLSAVVEGRVDKKAGNSPSDRIFSRKEKKVQSLSVLFLVDMSASTGSPAPPEHQEPRFHPSAASFERKILDVEIESLVVVMEALESLSHPCAIYGFSGHGRNEVDFYGVKDFPEPSSETIQRRLAGMEPRRATRMGPAIRHAVTKLAKAETEQRLLILLSDGFPQDFDYGEDRSSYEYGIHDTMMALMEAKYRGIETFCVTVDPGGKDYLKKMCDPGSYLVLRNLHSLPEMLPKVLASLIQ
jgi:hypothetical protein